MLIANNTHAHSFFQLITFIQFLNKCVNLLPTKKLETLLTEKSSKRDCCTLNNVLFCDMSCSNCNSTNVAAKVEDFKHCK